MYKRQSTFDKTVALFGYMAALLQAVLGIVWLSQNITVFNPNEISMNYIKASESLVVDDYMGILYAIFLKCFLFIKGSEGVIVLPLYLVQLCLAGGSVYAFIKLFWGERVSSVDKLVLTALVLFNPVFLQVICDVSVRALLCSLSLCFIAGMREFIKTGLAIWYGMAAFSACAIVFLNYDFGIMIVISLFVLLIVNIRKDKTVFAWSLVLMTLVIICIVLNSAAMTPYAYGRCKRSIGALMMQRFVWPELINIEDSISFNYGIDLGHATRNATTSISVLFSEFLLELEKQISWSEIKDLYMSTSLMMININTKQVLKAIFSEAGLYALGIFAMPFIYLLRIPGTLCAYPLKNFLQNNYGLGVAYFSFFESFLLLTFSLGIAVVIRRKIVSKKKRLIWGFIGLWALSVIYNLFFVLRGYDYRNTIYVVVIFEIVISGLLFAKRESA